MKGVLFTSILFGVLLSEVVLVSSDVKLRIIGDEGDKETEEEKMGNVLETDDISYDGEDINEILERDKYRLLNDNFEESSKKHVKFDDDTDKYRLLNDNFEETSKEHVKFDDDIKIFPDINRADNYDIFQNLNDDDDYYNIDDDNNSQTSNQNEIKVDDLTEIHQKNDPNNEEANDEDIEANKSFYDYNDIPNDKHYRNEQEDSNIKEVRNPRKSYKYSIKDRNISLLPHKRVTKTNKNNADSRARYLSPTVNSMSSYFYCSTESETSELIFYGTNSWAFPIQDVNLTLSYPFSQESSEPAMFWITGFKVVVYIDGTETRGCISKGGLLQDHIALTFINSEISALIYRFWLFGSPKSAVDDREMSTKTFECY